MCIRDRVKAARVGRLSAHPESVRRVISGQVQPSKLGILTTIPKRSYFFGSSHSSSSTPRVAFGCKKAISRPSAPLRGALSISCTPVSYTHLDVYKRQVLTARCRFAGLAKQTVLDGLSRNAKLLGRSEHSMQIPPEITLQFSPGKVAVQLLHAQRGQSTMGNLGAVLNDQGIAIQALSLIHI